MSIYLSNGAGYDTRSFFKWSTTCLKLEFFSPRLVIIPRLNNPVWYSCNIMAEGFRFMPLSLVRLRTFRLSA